MVGYNVAHIDKNIDKTSGIYFAKYYGQGGGWCRGKIMKNEAVSNTMKKKEKGKQERVIFLLIYGTLLLIILY